MALPTYTNQKKGFTLVELMIVIAISGIVLTGASRIYQSLQQTSSAQEKILTLQENTRVAMSILTNELHTAGYDPTASGNFGITDIKFRDLNNSPDTTANGNSSITFTMDLNGNQNIDTNETYSYSLYDYPEAVVDFASRDLSRNTGGGRQLLIENIQALGLAFAIDAMDPTDVDNDGNLNESDGSIDTDGAGNIIWVIDQSNDSSWDSLDTNNDGAITAADAPAPVNGVSTINATATGSPFRLNDIRAIRVWILARSKLPEQGFIDTETYIVGRQILIPSQIPNEINGGGYRYRLLESIVNCRNLGL
ncbi:MAG: prepilin-type N-terminal cleavage/methylation domain-containing protein [Proteobacteria bacterium]|nr:prepilin-type N-terminal cleavage/methylation domain-containing protein [Desulfobulbaceae bacterium]MBU4153340.1 prepilin-type N-terminal cleavage/methylation domain-containing protein [Pseudomonadota bacterium]